MREIVTPTGAVYAWVSVDERCLNIKLNAGSAKGKTVKLDKAIIPQLKNILAEAEFFKCL